MRELTEQEMEMVVGGDGIALPGGNYISTTRTITTGLGVIGAIDVGWRIGSAIGAGVNYAYARGTGGDLAHDLGGMAYNS